MLRYLKQVWESKFARNVALVASGTAAAQIISIVFSPIITRLYGPEAFGVLGTYTALLAILTPIAALSYPIAIVLPKHDGDAKGLVKLSLKISLITSCIVAVILLVAEKPLLELLNIGELGQFIWFVPLAMLLSVWLAVATQWSVRKKLFRLQAKVAIANAILQNGLKSGIGLFAPFAWVLIIVTTLGSALNAALFYFGIGKESKRNVGPDKKLLSERQLAKQHGDFAYFRTPQIVLNAASQSMPVLMLTAFYGPSAAGLYVLGKTVLGAPSQLIGQSVYTVFYPHFNEAVQSGKSAFKLLLRSTLSLLLLGMMPFGIVMIFGPELFQFVFGIEWVMAGEWARWLSLWFLFSLAARPAIAAIPVLNIQGFFLSFEVAAGLIRFFVLFGVYLIEGSSSFAVLSFSLINVVIYITLIGLVGKRVLVTKVKPYS